MIDHRMGVDESGVGPAKMRNLLARGVKTTWLSFLDDDDLMLPNHLAEHSEYFDTADVIFSWGMVIHPDGSEALFDSSYNEESILKGHNTIPVTATVRRSYFERVGGFPENERFEDWALWKRLILAGAKFQCIPKVTWHYRVGLGQNRNEKE